MNHEYPGSQRASFSPVKTKSPAGCRRGVEGSGQVSLACAYPAERDSRRAGAGKAEERKVTNHDPVYSPLAEGVKSEPVYLTPRHI